jgi:amino acid permease
MPTTSKNSSLSTVLALYNNMLGGALLSFPILFRDAGLISSTIITVVSCLISYFTCRIYVMHNRKD